MILQQGYAYFCPPHEGKLILLGKEQHGLVRVLTNCDTPYPYAISVQADSLVAAPMRYHHNQAPHG